MKFINTKKMKQSVIPFKFKTFIVLFTKMKSLRQDAPVSPILFTVKDIITSHLNHQLNDHEVQTLKVEFLESGIACQSIS